MTDITYKTVRVRMIAEYDIKVPDDWGPGDVEFHRNEGSWCADNAIDEILALKGGGCLCGHVEFEYIKDKEQNR